LLGRNWNEQVKGSCSARRSSMPVTFAQLGIPFPLFEGPVEGTEYRGLGTCTLCRRPAQHCFRLGIGCAVMLPCPACGTVTGPDGDGRALFEEVVQDAVPGLWEDRLHDVTGVYVFRCPACGRLSAHWDIA